MITSHFVIITALAGVQIVETRLFFYIKNLYSQGIKDSPLIS